MSYNHVDSALKATGLPSIEKFVLLVLSLDSGEEITATDRAIRYVSGVCSIGESECAGIIRSLTERGYIKQAVADIGSYSSYKPINKDADHYIYVYAHHTYGGGTNAKIGVSQNPEKRRFKYDIGGLLFYKKFLAPSRAVAFDIERAIKNKFKDIRYAPNITELFKISPQRLCSEIVERLNVY